MAFIVAEDSTDALSIQNNGLSPGNVSPAHSVCNAAFFTNEGRKDCEINHQ